MSESFGAVLRRLREAAGLSQSELAGQVPVDKSRLSRWENNKSTPSSATVDRLDDLVGAHGELRRAHAADTAPPVPVPRHDAGQPVDADDLVEWHDTVRNLVALDGKHGGAELAPFAARLFRSAADRLGSGNCPAALESDAAAVVAELGELSAWLAFDSMKFTDARALNLEALHLARLAGDRHMELFLLGNMCLVAQEQHRPREALRTVRLMESFRLSPRMRAMTLLRKARASADLGAPRAIETIDQARVLAEESIRRDDPAWSWWVNGSEIAAHRAGIHRARGDWSAAAHAYAAALDDVPEGYRWFRYIGSANLLEATVHLDDWQEAERLARDVLTLSTDIHSARASRRLNSAADAAERRGAPADLQQLTRALTAA